MYYWNKFNMFYNNFDESIFIRLGMLRLWYYNWSSYPYMIAVQVCLFMYKTLKYVYLKYIYYQSKSCNKHKNWQISHFVQVSVLIQECFWNKKRILKFRDWIVNILFHTFLIKAATHFSYKLLLKIDYSIIIHFY